MVIWKRPLKKWKPIKGISMCRWPPWAPVGRVESVSELSHRSTWKLECLSINSCESHSLRVAPWDASSPALPDSPQSLEGGRPQSYSWHPKWAKAPKEGTANTCPRALNTHKPHSKAHPVNHCTSTLTWKLTSAFPKLAKFISKYVRVLIVIVLCKQIILCKLSVWIHEIWVHKKRCFHDKSVEFFQNSVMQASQ